MELAKYTNESGQYDYDKKEVQVLLRNTVAKGATDEEFAIFREMCRTTGLNPFKKEIWFIKPPYGPIQMMTGINGFYAIANANPQFDGLELEYGPIQQVEPSDNAEHKVSILAPEYVDAKAYRKDRSRPQTARAYWSEYAKDLVTQKGKLSIWAKMPSVMLSKCAESMALRKAFPQELNGLYSAEEMPESYHAPKDADDLQAAVKELEEKAAQKEFAREKLIEADAGKDAVEAKQEQLAEELDEEAYNDYLAELALVDPEFEFGTYKGKRLSQVKNGPYIKNYMKKYDADLTEHWIECAEQRLEELRKEWKAENVNSELLNKSA